MKSDSSVVQNQRDLDALTSKLENIIGLDTEFHRRTTFFPTPCILQVATTKCASVVDLLAPLNLDRLESRIFSDDLIKVMHSPREDLELFYLIFGKEMPNIIDVQLAHAFVSTDSSLSYSALVDYYLDHPFKKNSKLTQSDWRTRPLKPPQMEYALDDVKFLIPLWHQIRAELKRLGRESWFHEEMQHFFLPVYQFGLSNVASISDHARWKPIDFAVYFGLLEWRERTARARNCPRERVLTNKALRTLTENHDKNKDFFIKNFRTNGSRLYRTISQVKRRFTRSNQLHFRNSNRLSPSAVKTLQRFKEPIKELVAQKSKILCIAPETLGKSQHISAWITHFEQHQEFPPEFGTWREAILGTELRAILTAG